MNKAKTEGIECRNLPMALAGIETRSDGDGESKKIIIAGYAAVFYDGTERTEFKIGDDYIERIMPGAFDRALREKHDVRGLLNHDSNHLLGRSTAGTLNLFIDSIGLRYEIKPPDTQVGRDTVVSLKRGDLTGSSFAFIQTEASWVEDGEIWIREVRDLDLFDVGPVTYPAYNSTSSETAKRSLADFIKKRGTPKRDRVELELKISELSS